MSGMTLGDNGIAITSDEAPSGYAITIADLEIDVADAWVKCGSGAAPLVKITKHPTEDRYRVLIKCPPDLKALTQ